MVAGFREEPADDEECEGDDNVEDVEQHSNFKVRELALRNHKGRVRNVLTPGARRRKSDFCEAEAKNGRKHVIAQLPKSYGNPSISKRPINSESNSR